ncbi:hypothetical protein CHS0354_016670 [Potamilus streckersoni]|uniref:RING-type E3 ubiquitin transferase n=1 Tax=Potamilus streckersoni TaxID=2493646 RepID=A0AAE0TIB8_9BIVA|nr:hypothetical protein CHS0354_016670 [Potamilus streckersoni]
MFEKKNDHKAISDAENKAEEGSSDVDRGMFYIGDCFCKDTFAVEDHQSQHSRESMPSGSNRIQKNTNKNSISSAISSEIISDQTTVPVIRKRSCQESDLDESSPGNVCVLKFLIKYNKSYGEKFKDDTFQHDVQCSFDFQAFWNFYHQKESGRRRLENIVAKWHCHVSLALDKLLKGLFVFRISDHIFKQKSDVIGFVEGILDTVYKHAKQELVLSKLSIDSRLHKEVLERVRETKELDTVWIEFGNEQGHDMMYTVYLLEHQMIVTQRILDIVHTVEESFNNHEELVGIDLVWQRVMINFGYLQEVINKFPNFMINHDETKKAFVLKGPRDEAKAAADTVLELLGTAQSEISEVTFAPGCQIEIFSYPKMCDYINKSIPKVPVVWISDHLSNKIHLLAKPEHLHGIDKAIKGCVQEKLYLVHPQNSISSHEIDRYIEELKKLHMGKIVIHSSTTSLLVTAADDIYETVDAAIRKIISRERGADQAAQRPEKDDKRNKPPGSKTARADGYQEPEGLLSKETITIDRKITKTVNVENKDIFLKLVEEDLAEFKRRGQEQNVIIQEVEKKSKVGFELKGCTEKEIGDVFQYMRERIELKVQQLQPKKNGGESMGATACLEKEKTEHPSATVQSDSNEMPGQDHDLQLLISFSKSSGGESKDNVFKHSFQCSFDFQAFWNFYHQTDCGRKMLEDMVTKQHCHVSLASDKILQGLFVFKISDQIFQKKSDVIEFVKGILDTVYKHAEQELVLSKLAVDLRLHKEVLERVRETKELDTVWIEFGNEQGHDMMYTVYLLEHQMIVTQRILDIVHTVEESFNNHEELVGIDLVWQRVMINFGYLQEVINKFPNFMINHDETKKAFVLKGPRDEAKAAADTVLELLGTAQSEISEVTFAPGCQIEIFSYPKMCDYINKSIPKVPVVWISDHLSNKIHLLAKPEHLHGIDKAIKGCVQEKLYLVHPQNSISSHEIDRYIEELKKLHMGKIVIHSSTTSLLVTAADDIYETVDAAIRKIISRERGADQAAQRPEKDDKRNKPPGSKTARADGYQEPEGLLSKETIAIDRKITKTVNVENKDIFLKLVEEDLAEFKRRGQEQNVIIQEVEKKSKVGFELKGCTEKEIGDVFQYMRERIELKVQQLQPKKNGGESMGATACLEKEKTEHPSATVQSDSNEMPGGKEKSGMQHFVWTYPSSEKVILLKDISCDADVILLPEIDGGLSTECSYKKDAKRKLCVPMWNGGEKKEKETLHEEVKKALIEISAEEQKSVGICINPIGGWEFQHYLKSFLYQIDQYYNGSAGTNSVQSLVLFTNDEDLYIKACSIIQQYLENKLSVDPQKHKPRDTSSPESKQGPAFKKIIVSIEQGELHDAQAEVLVNTISPNLDLTKGAISASLSFKAGTGLQKEVNQYKSPVSYGVILKTGACQLPSPCRAVYHGALKKYSPHDDSILIFKEFLLNCLQKASESKYKSIAFPAIGTGNLGYPKDAVASLMLTSVMKLETVMPNTSLRKVKFVIYPTDTETYQAFQKQLKCLKSGPKEQTTVADQKKVVPVVSGISKILKYGQVQVQAKLGAFENENQNCLLVLWETQDLYTISDKNHILSSAGSTVTQKWREHRNRAQFHHGHVLVTPGGRIKYTETIHVACDINNIKTAAKDGLMQADHEKMKTVVVPIILGDSFLRDAKKFCIGILNAVNELAAKLKYVKSVTLVIQGQHNFPLFNEVFEQESRLYGAEKKTEASKNSDVNEKKTVQSPISVPPLVQQWSPISVPPLVQQISPIERGLNPKAQQQLVKGAEVLLAGHKIQLGLTDEDKCCIIVSGDIKSKEDLVERFSSYHDQSNKVKHIVYPYEEKSALVIFEKEVDFQTLGVFAKPFRVEHIRPELFQNLEFLLSDALVERANSLGQMETMTATLEEKSGVHIKKTNNQIFVCAVTIHQMVIAQQYLEHLCEKRLSIKINNLGKIMSSNTQDEESYDSIDKLNEVSEVEFKALEILENGFKKMKNIQLSWDEKNAILIQGTQELTVSFKQYLSKQLEVLRTKQTEEIPLDEEENNVVKDVIEEMHSDDIIFVFSEKKSQVVVYSDKQDNIMKFKHKLKFRSGKVKESGRSGRRFTDVNKSQATETPDRCFRSLGQRQQFSGSKDALDKAVFYTKENIIVAVYMADILNLPVDCIVNAANDRLQHGGGVARVIADAAGPELVKDGDAIIREKGMIPVGVQVTTTAGRLPYKCVIHTVGPCWSNYQPHTLQKVKDCEEDLYAAIHGCFLEAEKNFCFRIALPAVSSGIYAVPQDMCAVQYAKAVLDYSRKSIPGKSLTEIHFVDKLPRLVKLIQDTFKTMLSDGKEPNYNVNNYVISSSVSQRRSNTTTGKGHQSHEDYQHGQAAGLKNAGNSSHHGLVEKIDFSPVYYESEEHGKKQSVFQISQKPVVRIYKGNVLEVKNMDAVICSDDKNGSGMWSIASELKRNEKYKKQKEAAFKKEKPGLGDVVVTYAGEHSYHVIFHVVIETYETKKSDFECAMRKCIDKILKKAHEWVHVKKIAVPLFGIKTGYLTEEFWAKLFLDRFVAFCCEFKNPDLEEIHIVTHFSSSNAYDKVKKIFRDYYEETNRDQNKKNVPPPRPPLPCRYGTDNIGIQESSSDKGHGSANMDVDTADDCVICMSPMSNPRTLPCGHSFCAGCVDELFKHKPVCPACGKIVGILTGDQPGDGIMDVKKFPSQLAGYEGHGSIWITYTFPHGRQGPSHPTPGAFYGSMARTAYLPDTSEGRTICRMLQLAFERRLVFTISQSRTTGKEGLTWNDIHHKTNRNPGTEFGYPDPEYLSRVKDELAAKGITEADLKQERIGSFRDSIKH